MLIKRDCTTKQPWVIKYAPFSAILEMENPKIPVGPVCALELMPLANAADTIVRRWHLETPKVGNRLIGGGDSCSWLGLGHPGAGARPPACRLPLQAKNAVFSAPRRAQGCDRDYLQVSSGWPPLFALRVQIPCGCRRSKARL
jgi:hypothetical protein